MKTKEQIETEFRKDLKELLEMYGAEMEIEYDYHEEGHINISILQTYDKDGEIEKEYTDFDL